MTAYEMALMSLLTVSAAGNPAGEPKPAGPDSNTMPIAEGNSRFALQIYQRLQDDQGNLFFSPYSISTALAMTYAGARGRTQQQMAQVLSFPTAHVAQPPSAGEQGTTAGGGSATRAPMPPEKLAEVFGEMIKDLNERGTGDKYELRIANALWGQKDYRFLPSFVQLVENQYGGALRNVDFIAAAEPARRTINNWVAKQTNDKIKDLISPGALNFRTRLVLTNAIYFKGNWASQFEKDRTRDQPFTLLDGTKAQVAMMSQQSRFNYGQTDTLQVLEMPYKGDDLSMVILLPKKTDGIKALEQDLAPENLAKWLTNLRRRQVIVFVPKLKMTSKFSLAQVLQSMGMTDAFTDRADFSGMTGNRDLYLSAVIHQAYVDVNEEGTEAAAATGAVVGITSIGPDMTPVFRADHPFLFLIRDRATGSILFLGRVLNPQP
ncbi:MAG: serpin family protein [Sedimentisphaerales bacterium]|nr:serpin family protein [Sedimentisphaerales bacterium]